MWRKTKPTPQYRKLPNQKEQTIMTDEQIKKKEIESALAKIPDSDFLETTKDLLAVLGYRSERTAKLWETVDEFIEALPARNRNTETEREFRR